MSWQYNCRPTQAVYFSTIGDFFFGVAAPRINFDIYQKEVHAGLLKIHNHFDQWLRYRKLDHKLKIREILQGRDAHVIEDELQSAYDNHFVNKLKAVYPTFPYKSLVLFENVCFQHKNDIQDQALETERQMGQIMANGIANSSKSIGDSAKIAAGYILPYKSSDTEIAKVTALLKDKIDTQSSSDTFDAELFFNDAANAAIALIKPVVEHWEHQCDLSFAIFNTTWEHLKKFYNSNRATDIKDLQDRYNSCKKETNELVQAFTTNPVELATMTVDSLARNLQENAAAIFRCVNTGPHLTQHLDEFFFRLEHERRLK